MSLWVVMRWQLIGLGPEICSGPAHYLAQKLLGTSAVNGILHFSGEFRREGGNASPPCRLMAAIRCRLDGAITFKEPT
jgi:hypothetical protein